jgi:hypothetical protein
MNIWFGIRVELVLHSAGLNQNHSLKVFVIIEPPISGEILNLLLRGGGGKRTGSLKTFTFCAFTARKP